MTIESGSFSWPVGIVVLNIEWWLQMEYFIWWVSNGSWVLFNETLSLFLLLLLSVEGSSWGWPVSVIVLDRGWWVKGENLFWSIVTTRFFIITLSKRFWSKCFLFGGCCLFCLFDLNLFNIFSLLFLSIQYFLLLFLGKWRFLNSLDSLSIFEWFPIILWSNIGSSLWNLTDHSINCFVNIDSNIIVGNISSILLMKRGWSWSLWPSVKNSILRIWGINTDNFRFLTLCEYMES